LTFSVSSGTSTIAFVQQNYATPQSPTATVAVPFKAAQSAGNLNVAIVGWNDATRQVQSVADTNGNVYTRAVGPTVQAGTASQSIYYAKNIKAAAANANTLTVTFTAAATAPDIRIAEYRGLDPVNPFDAAVAAQGTSGTSNSGALTTTGSTDLLVAGNLVQQTTTGAGTGFTSRVITTPDADILEDRIVTVAGSYSATAPLTSGAWIMQLVAFRAASGGGTTGTMTTLSALNDGPVGEPAALGAIGRTTDATRRSDYDGDGKADIVAYQPSGTWEILESHSGFTTSRTIAWGTSSDVPVPGDYDGDGKTDLGLFNPATGQWHILLSSTSYATSLAFTLGTATDIPVPGDYDGDGQTDLAFYRPSTGQWQILTSSSGYTTAQIGVLGTSGDRPVPGDYDGDGKTDLAVFNPATAQWRILFSSTGATTTKTWGVNGDIPVAGDYDGDGTMDLAVYRPSTGSWDFLYSKANFTSSASLQWGIGTDVPVVGDYDGDGKADLGLFTASGWKILLSGSGYATSLSLTWGSSSDSPLPIHP